MPATHRYDSATRTVIIEGEDAGGEQYFYDGGEYGIDDVNPIDLDIDDVSGGHVNCNFNGIRGRVLIWVVPPGCDCCADWSGNWYIKLAAIRVS